MVCLCVSAIEIRSRFKPIIMLLHTAPPFQSPRQKVIAIPVVPGTGKEEGEGGRGKEGLRGETYS